MDAKREDLPFPAAGVLVVRVSTGLSSLLLSPQDPKMLLSKPGASVTRGVCGFECAGVDLTGVATSSNVSCLVSAGAALEAFIRSFHCSKSSCVCI